MTHYEVLGVSPNATHDEIRRAYHDQARRWHPDRVGEGNDAVADAAEDSIRQINEAWRVLGDDHRRRAYDAVLAGTGSSPRPGVSTVDGITRIDPRLLDPAFLAARRRLQIEEAEYRNSWILRALPIVALVVLAVGIVVFTAYARTPGSGSPTTSFPGPEIGIPAGACVKRLPDAGLLTVDCNGNEDGILFAVTQPGVMCPPGTRLSQPVRDGMTACLR